MTTLYMLFLGAVLLVLAVAACCWRHDRGAERSQGIGYAHRNHGDRGPWEVGDG